MSEIRYNLQFDKLCEHLRLGELVCVPEGITGGLLHKMYSLQTTQGRYAVKALNPQIMLRPTAMEKYFNSEGIANIAAKHIPALPAKRVDDHFIHEIDNQIYLVFDWIEGKSLKLDEIDIAHCMKMGSLLADIHNTDFSELSISHNRAKHEQLIDWNFYLQKGLESNAVWANLLIENIDKLCHWSAEANRSEKLLASDFVISHRDLDPKNVMWNQDNPVVIDWEAAGYINPTQELIETAIYWAEDLEGNIIKERFLAFIGGYQAKCRVNQANWRTALLSSFLGKLGWLEYSLKRSLMIECTDEEEQRLGTAQAIGTIGAISRYAEVVTEIEEWLKNVCKCSESVRAVGVFLLYKNKFAFMVGPNRDGSKLGIVRLGGHVEENEGAIACAVREVKEEASVRINMVSSPKTYYMRNWEDETYTLVDDCMLETKPIVKKGDETGATMIFLAYTQEQLVPAAEAHGIILLTEEDVFMICDNKISLRAFVNQGGELLQSKDMNYDLELSAGPHVRFLCNLLKINDNAIRNFIDQGSENYGKNSERNTERKN